MTHLPHIIVLLVAVLCMPLMAAVDTKLSTYTYNLQKGWNLIGIVLEPTDESEQELLAHKLYDYNGEKNVKSYQQSVEVTAGKPYWLYSDAGESLFIKGTRIDTPTDEPAPQEGTRTLTIGTQDDIEIGEEVTITVPAKEGYTFTGWTVDGVSIPDTTQETITFTMPANKVTLSVNYERAYTYLVVDLTSGATRYEETVPNLNNDIWRTTELWLRKIPKGTYIMGSPTDEVGRTKYETQHQVTLSKDFYIGIFEITQKQYELITGTYPSSSCSGDCRSAVRISYDMIRGNSLGATWPTSNSVDDDSFLAKLRKLTGLLFDLPTEAQWEYACRAGTTTALNNGTNITSTEQDNSLNDICRYSGNNTDCKGGYTYLAKVGSYLPNSWGLYDMEGNASEWCLDWYGPLEESPVVDPVGNTTGTSRISRGGDYTRVAAYCRSAYRTWPLSPDCTWSDGSGFRVVMLPNITP